MQAGVSSACLYPQHLEEALYDLAVNGIGCAELFVNADSDLDRTRIHTMQEIMQRFGVCVPSMHPFACPIEPLMMFTAYDRRLEDMIQYYRRFFASMQKFGAKIFVFHGNDLAHAMPAEQYCERYLRLVNAGKEFGITVAQENVSRCQSGSLHFLREMIKILGDDAHFVLDVKQAVRAGESPINMLHMLGSHVCHVHISDHNETEPCLPIGAGNFRIRSFMEALRRYSPDCSVILELYRDSYRGISDLVSGYRMLSHMIASVERSAESS
ncbi:MAG: sugar phosphate isomerase/epimerase [Oscillospiraceae bacterium]|nr:sugar phosphate isomerase/epimerase [Oscillospiraceae bacterium]